MVAGTYISSRHVELPMCVNRGGLWSKEWWLAWTGNLETNWYMEMFVVFGQREYVFDST